MKIAGVILCIFLTFTLAAQATLDQLTRNMTGVSPAVKEHLTQVLREMEETDSGRFLLDHVSPQLQFSAKPMKQLGLANSRSVITLESLRLENNMIPVNTENLRKTKICFTGEILAHEMLHNAQFHAGLFQYPDECSGYERVLFEKLMELQAKQTGEKMFQTLRSKETFRSFVQEKAGLFLVMKLQSKEPDKDYPGVLWRNNPVGETQRIFREQIEEIHQWNRAYNWQAFCNSYRYFLENDKAGSREKTQEHLTRIIRFAGMPLDAAELLEQAPVKPIPHGIACYEDGKKVMELEAVPGAVIRRDFSGSVIIRQTRHAVVSNTPVNTKK